ncbi:MAG: activator of (R)-2-hydroxyglutaryl-CoA dehydratase [Pseudomonadota bacterium]
MTSSTQQYRLKPERPFVRSERESVTVLSGGLTLAHERLVQAGLRALGYHSTMLPNPDLESYGLGREHCSNGLCNPSYFTIGNLLKYLRQVQAEQGLSAQQVCDRYVMYTAGSYGPCRFGMYESEYRLALESAGFKDFRVVVFQQSSGLVQSHSDTGLDLDALFFMVHIKAFLLGDVVNELYHAIKPYELEPGAADRARVRALDELESAMAAPPTSRSRALVEQLLGLPLAQGERASHLLRWAQALILVAEQVRGDEPAATLQRAARHFDQVQCDRLRVKPVVKITGEFWAQTTESDGNFNMLRVLEESGAEVIAEPIGTWMDYLLNLGRERLRGHDAVPSPTARGRLQRALSSGFSRARVPLQRGLLRAVSRLVEREYDRLCHATNDVVMPLVDQDELMELSRPFYDPRLYGGEGHLEVGKTIHYSQDRMAHMVMSLKPFGCMPSTQSDGAQPAVLAAYPDILFLPVETSSDGEGPALSRVQMMLAEARARARIEWQQLLEAQGVDEEVLRAYVDQHPELRRGLWPLDRHHGPATTAVRFAGVVLKRMRAEGWTADAPRGSEDPVEDLSTRARGVPNAPVKGAARVKPVETPSRLARGVPNAPVEGGAA